MSSTAALRPGIALGPYPQREDQRDSWLDRAAAGLGGFIRQRAYGRTPGHQEFLSRVNAEARHLDGLSDKEIREGVPELRRRRAEAVVVAGHPVQGDRVVHHRLRAQGRQRQ